MSELPTYKFVIVGAPRTGKTSITRTYLGSEFMNSYQGTEAMKKQIGKFNIQIWDLGATHSSQMLFDDYLREVDCAIIVFNISDRSSFQNVGKWWNFINRKRVGEIPKALVGNKIDLRGTIPEEVEKKEADVIAQRFSYQSVFEVPYIETSAKTGFNVDFLFGYLISATENLKEN